MFLFGYSYLDITASFANSVLLPTFTTSNFLSVNSFMVPKKTKTKIKYKKTMCTHKYTHTYIHTQRTRISFGFLYVLRETINI